MIGLFQTKEYQEVFRYYFSKDNQVINFPEGSFEIADMPTDKQLGRAGSTAVFLGMKPVLDGQEVSDYGDIVTDVSEYGKSWEKIIKELKVRGVKKLRLDYVREDSETYRVFRDNVEGREVTVEEQEVSPYLDLPKTWDDYLASLKRKHRKELKRKIRRLEEQSSFYRCTEETLEKDFEDFIRLHRLSDPAKNKFMTDKMKGFFWKMKTTKVEGWNSHLCFLKIDEKPVAGVMTFEQDKEVWLYNSGYDPTYGYYSVGLLLVAYKIKKAIEEGKEKFDFLRGNERYKYDLGAKDLKLYKIEINLQ